MKTYTRKIGLNRGKPRLWLEGAILLDNGFTQGDRWEAVRYINGGQITLDLVKGALGLRRIAGTPARPIIDINSGSLLEGFSGEVVVRGISEGWLQVILKEQS